MSGHLLHVGYPKTGSNFLRRWFRDHPQLAYSEGGIAGFQSVYDIARQGAAPQEDVRYRVTSSESIVLSDTRTDPAEAQERTCTLLADLFPNAHVLIVTRGFRSMIFSSYSQFIRSGADVTLEEFVAHPLLGQPWDYDRVLAMYERAFGAEKVIVLPYELLRDDADRFVRALEERLGLTHQAAKPGRVNTSLSAAEMYWYPRWTRVVQRLPIGSRLKHLYLRGIFANRFRSAVAALQRVRPGTPVTADAIPEELIASYRAKASLLRAHPLYAPYARDYYGSDR